MGAMHIRIDTRIRVKVQVRDGEAIRIVRTIKTMDGGIVRITCHYPQVNEPPPEKKVDLEQALAQMLTSHTAFMNKTKVNL